MSVSIGMSRFGILRKGSGSRFIVHQYVLSRRRAAAQSGSVFPPS